MAGLCGGSARAGRFGAAVRLAGLVQVLRHVGQDDGNKSQNDEHQKAGLVMIGVEQRLKKVAHRELPFRFPRNRSVGWFTARYCRSRPASWARR